MHIKTHENNCKQIHGTNIQSRRKEQSKKNLKENKMLVNG